MLEQAKLTSGVKKFNRRCLFVEGLTGEWRELSEEMKTFSVVLEFWIMVCVHPSKLCW